MNNNRKEKQQNMIDLYFKDFRFSFYINMISLLTQEYSLLNIIVICIQIFCPLVLYLVSVLYITEAQEKWMKTQSDKFTFKFLNDTKGIFAGSVVYTLVGIASLLVLDFYYRINNGLDVGKTFLSFLDSGKTNGRMNACLDKIGFIAFPLAVILSILGRVVTIQTNNFVTEMVMSCVTLPCIAFLMYLYSTRVSYAIASLLMPLLVWEVMNIVAIAPLLKQGTSAISSSSELH